MMSKSALQKGKSSFFFVVGTNRAPPERPDPLPVKSHPFPGVRAMEDT